MPNNHQESFQPPSAHWRDRVDLFLAETESRNSWLGWLCLGLIVTIIISALVFPVDVTLRAPAMVRTEQERIELRAPASGKVAELYIRDNASVTKGQLLLRMATDALDNRIDYLQVLRTTVIEEIQDLSRLTAAMGWVVGEWRPIVKAENLSTAARQSDLSSFQSAWTVMQVRESGLRQEWLRSEELQRRGVIAVAEGERVRNQWELLKAEIAREWTAQRSTWVQALKHLQDDLRKLESEMGDLKLKQEESMVRAPLSGEVLSLGGLTDGAEIFSGQRLAILSPSDPLCIEVWATPAQLAQVRPGQHAKFAADALPYTHWGFVEGKVSEIAPDLSPEGAYRITIQPETTGLTTRTGKEAHLQRGMSGQARMVIARKRVFAVLLQNAANWLEPPRPPVAKKSTDFARPPAY